MNDLIKSCGVYLDWDNIWGGILHFFSIRVDPQHPITLTQNQKNQIEQFITIFSHKLHESQSDVRYIKAFADFDRLPYANTFSPSVTNILHNAEIEPFPSFVRAGKFALKDASDRSLMLEVVEDIFFAKKIIDCVIIASGDVDFYPLITFVREHSEKKICLLSFSRSLNSFYKTISYLKKDGGIILIDDLMSSHTFTTLPLPIESSIPLEGFEMASGKAVESTSEESGDQIYISFKNQLIKTIKQWERNKQQSVKTGLVIRSWIPRWEPPLTIEAANIYLDRMQKEGLINITSINPDNPNQGIIKIL
jgi:uncharacterized LabA/DUF88 family protein